MRTNVPMVAIWGLFLVLSTALLIPTLTVQTYASRCACPSTALSTLPPVDSVYAINVVGTAHVAGTDTFEPVSAHMEFRVLSTESTGIPSVFLELIAGKLSLGDDVYALDKGSTIIMADKVNIKVASEDGTKILTVYATLADSLPVSTSADSAGLVPAIHDRSASIQVYADKWILDFSGDISRIA